MLTQLDQMLSREYTATENAELCEAMAAELEEHGHCTGNYQTPDGRLCLLGAARKVVAGSVWTTDAWATLALKRARDVLGVSNVPILNDGGTIVIERDGAVRFETYSDDAKALNKDTAIEFCINRAKYWREQG